MDNNYTPKARRKRMRDLLEGIPYSTDINPYISRVEADGGTTEAIACLNEAIWKLTYN